MAERNVIALDSVDIQLALYRKHHNLALSQIAEGLKEMATAQRQTYALLVEIKRMLKPPKIER